MATNLVIGYAEIPQASVTTTVSQATLSNYPIENLWGGNKTDGYLMQPERNSFYVKFDLSTTPKAADFVFMSKANEFCNEVESSFTIRAGANSTHTSNSVVVSCSNAQISANLCGPEQEEFISIFPQTAACRYWSIEYANTQGATTSSFAHSKLFIGKAFDPGMDPNAPATITRFRTGGFRRKSTFSFSFSWEGMRYDKAVEMYTLFYLTERYQPLVILSRDWHDLIMGNRSMLCRITEMSLPPRITDYCDVSATFEELT